MSRKKDDDWKQNIRNFIQAKASFTIEAAAVMPIVLFSIVAMILACYKAHDILFANLSANEAVEVYGHLPEITGEDTDSVSAAINNSLSTLFSGREYTISLEENGDGASATILGEGDNRTFEDSGFRPEKTLRSVTLIEEILNND